MEIIGPHWYVRPLDECQVCQLSAPANIHLRRCGGTFSGWGKPGFAFCRLVEGHEGRHEVVWWNGEVTAINVSKKGKLKNLEVIVDAQPTKIEP
jgi:hypothetical protein